MHEARPVLNKENKPIMADDGSPKYVTEDRMDQFVYGADKKDGVWYIYHYESSRSDFKKGGIEFIDNGQKVLLVPTDIIKELHSKHYL